VVRPANVRGAMLALSYADCGFPKMSYTFGWVPSGPQLDPGCSPVQQWHVRVAWLNHPVAGFDYVAPTPTFTSTPVPTATPAPSPTASPTGPTFVTILHRSLHAMAAVHSLHAVGLKTYRDSSSGLTLHIQGDCRSSAGTGFPIALRTLISGQYTNAGHTIPRHDGYLIDGPVIPTAHTTTRAWERIPGSRRE
jgi:hypothetical protein